MRLRTTAASHRRVHVCEVMGRHAGWIACYGGIAGAADYILVPEQPVAFDRLLESVKRRHAKGGDTIVVVAEGARLDGADPAARGARDAFGHERLGGVGEGIARAIEQATGIETRAVVLGHLQRGGSPTAFDRVLATRFGIAATDLVAARKFGRMVALSGSRVVDVPIEAAVGTLKTLDMGLYELAASFFE
jgi:ATP-dependent phosphofructokinase / diphosphate-dependent phosphofructokinase